MTATAKITLTEDDKEDVLKRFRKWLNYAPIIKKEDITEFTIDYYINDVLTIHYFDKQIEILSFLTETFLN